MRMREPLARNIGQEAHKARLRWGYWMVTVTLLDSRVQPAPPFRQRS
jgi:hypothetical protein